MLYILLESVPYLNVALTFIDFIFLKSLWLIYGLFLNWNRCNSLVNICFLVLRLWILLEQTSQLVFSLCMDGKLMLCCWIENIFCNSECCLIENIFCNSDCWSFFLPVPWLLSGKLQLSVWEWKSFYFCYNRAM